METLNEKKIFQLNVEKEEFEEIELVGDAQLHEVLDTDYVLAFIDKVRKTVWTWIGTNSSTKASFLGGIKSIKLRNQHAFGYKTVAEIEGEESIRFKIFLGLEEPSEEREQEIKPMYDGTQDVELTKGDILLKLEKIPVAEGFERNLVVVKDQIFRYKENPDAYLGADIKSKKLYSLQEEINDGPYLLEEYTPQILFSFNKIVLIELLSKRSGKNMI